MKDKNKVYKLELTPEQARIVSRACELYSRLHIGQLRELNEELLLAESTDNICERREAAEDLLYELKEVYFPSLISLGHSYGLGKREWADRAWNVHQAIRHKMAWDEHPEGGLQVWFDPPLPLGLEPVPKCEIEYIQEERPN